MRESFMKNAIQLSAVLNKFCAIFFGFVNILLVAYYLDGVSQGFYYLIQTLIGLQVFAELGINYSIMQLTSSALGSNATRDKHTIIRIELKYLKFAIKWLLSCSIIVGLVNTPLGALVITARTDLGEDGTLGHIVNIWIAISLISSFTMPSIGLLYFFEGIGEIAKVILIRLIHQIGTGLLLIFFILMGYGIDSLVFSGMFGFLVLYSLIFTLFFHKLKEYRQVFLEISDRVSWKQDIAKFQVPMAISWLSGFISFQSIIILSYLFHGPVFAGKVGMTLQIGSAINSVSIAWLLSQASKLARYASKRRYKRLYILYDTEQRKGWVLNAGLVVLLMVSLYLITKFNITIQEKILDPFYISMLLVPSITANHIIFSRAIFLRSFSREPLMLCSVISAITLLCTGVLLIPALEDAGVLISNFVAVVLVTYPCVANKFKYKVQEIHPTNA